MVEKVAGGDQRYRTLGMIFAFTVLMTMIGGSVYLVSIDKEWYGVGLFGVSMVGIVKLFIQTKQHARSR